MMSSPPCLCPMCVSAPALMPGKDSQHPFYPALEQAIEVLEDATAKENWEVREKSLAGYARLFRTPVTRSPSFSDLLSCIKAPRTCEGRLSAAKAPRCRLLTGRLPSTERRAGDAHDAPHAS
ncbi:hypothetical protein BD310DRAFT_1006978 [Dichomitus squalens]|uniref:Uncharacterized protein n=1 Tax=Dichomitus squalens TaxID=114155 RepID=A0A4Q9PZH3_9APHY|nr:hypothetical protein BD310DRAFT_1006978 [Dichomitus squalens]